MARVIVSIERHCRRDILALCGDAFDEQFGGWERQPFTETSPESSRSLENLRRYTGSSTVNRAPCGRFRPAAMRPPCASTMARLMARPSPVPPVSSERDGSPR